MDDKLVRLSDVIRAFDEQIKRCPNSYCNGLMVAQRTVASIPAVDAVEVVRCRECNKWEEYENTAGCGYCHNKRFRFEYGGYHRSVFNPITEPDFSCMDGRREDGDT